MLDLNHIYKLSGRRTMTVHRLIRESSRKALYETYIGSLDEGYTQETVILDKRTGRVKRVEWRPWMKEDSK